MVVLVQGASSNVQEQKKSWNGHRIIFSTWVGEEDKYESGDEVIFNEKPAESGPANFNYQVVSTLNGLLYCQSVGVDSALKIRSDIVPTNCFSFERLLLKDRLNFLCWHEHEVYPECKGYLVDYLMQGNVEDMIKIWSIKENFCCVPEIMLTWSVIKNNLSNKVSYFLDHMSIDNDLIWIKHNIRLSSYQKNSRYDRYKKYDFSLNLKELKETYLSFLGTGLV